MKTVRELILKEVKHYAENIASYSESITRLHAILGRLPTELLDQEVVGGYALGKTYAIRNNNDEIPGLPAKVATWLESDDVRARSTSKDPIKGTTYFRFDLGDGFSLDVDCKPRPKCKTVRVRHVVEENITLCGELPEGYEIVE